MSANEKDKQSMPAVTDVAGRGFTPENGCGRGRLRLGDREHTDRPIDVDPAMRLQLLQLHQPTEVNHTSMLELLEEGNLEQELGKPVLEERKMIPLSNAVHPTPEEPEQRPKLLQECSPSSKGDEDYATVLTQLTYIDERRPSQPKTSVCVKSVAPPKPEPSGPTGVQPPHNSLAQTSKQSSLELPTGKQPSLNDLRPGLRDAFKCCMEYLHQHPEATSQILAYPSITSAECRQVVEVSERDFNLPARYLHTLCFRTLIVILYKK